jgi:Peptide chain release factor 1 (eRF1)
MQQNNLVKKLTEFDATDFPFISAYFNTQPDQNGKFNYNLTAENFIKENAEDFEARSPRRTSFDDDAKRITDFLENVDSTTKGVAIFASSGAGYFKGLEYSVPFEQDHFFVFDKPHIFPLVRLLEQNPPFAVLLADTNSAHIFVFQGGETLEKHDVENTKTNRSEVGGWSQARYQRHIENFHQQHAKEAVEELAKIARSERIDKIILAGDEAVIIPLLRAEIPKDLENCIVGSIPLNVHTPPHELLAAAQKAIHVDNTLEDKKKTDFLFEQNYDDGIGITGAEKTLAALLNGQVRELYLNADFDSIDYDERKMREVMRDYAPGLDEDLPSASLHGMVIDELIKQAMQSADEIRFIEDNNLLKDAGGIGALLRYQAKGVTNL